MDGYRAARVAEATASRDLAYYAAWHSGMFSQPYGKGRFPEFEKHAPWKKQARAQARTGEQLKAQAMAIAAAFGGEIRTAR